MLSTFVCEDINKVLRVYGLNINQFSNKTGVIYEENNTLIGYLYYTTNRFHPYSLHLHFKFMIENPDEEILSEMLNKLIAQLPNSNYILKLESNDYVYGKFIDSNNFIEIRKTYEPEISIDSLVNYYRYIECNYDSQSLPFIITDKLVHKVQEIYKCTHEANPLGDISLHEWRTVITNDIDLEHSIVIYNENKDIIAYLFIFDNSESVKEIGWVYFKSEEAKKQLLIQFKNTLLRLKKLGIKIIEFEIDNTDTYSYELFSPFIIHSFPSLITYMKYK